MSLARLFAHMELGKGNKPAERSQAAAPPPLLRAGVVSKKKAAPAEEAAPPFRDINDLDFLTTQSRFLERVQAQLAAPPALEQDNRYRAPVPQAPPLGTNPTAAFPNVAAAAMPQPQQQQQVSPVQYGTLLLQQQQQLAKQPQQSAPAQHLLFPNNPEPGPAGGAGLLGGVVPKGGGPVQPSIGELLSGITPSMTFGRAWKKALRSGVKEEEAGARLRLRKFMQEDMPELRAQLTAYLRHPDDTQAAKIEAAAYDFRALFDQTKKDNVIEALANEPNRGTMEKDIAAMHELLVAFEELVQAKEEEEEEEGDERA